jgi:hypothetical protein
MIALQGPLKDMAIPMKSVTEKKREKEETMGSHAQKKGEKKERERDHARGAQVHHSSHMHILDQT